MPVTPGAESVPSLRRYNLVAAGLLLVGLASMAGDATGLQFLRGLGAASVISPLPKVFSDVRGFETFAADFTLLVTRVAAETDRRPMTPELYAQMPGPYNRRNVYGAALSYAPRLPEQIWMAAFCYGFGPGGPLQSEFDLPADTADVNVLIESKTRGRDDSWVLDADCSER